MDLGDAAEILHVHVHQGAGVGVLVPTDGFARSAVDVRQPVEVRGREDAVHRRRRDTESGGELNGQERSFAARADDHAALHHEGHAPEHR